MVKRIREHIIGDIGETSSSLIFKQWGWTSDKITSDYGEDLDCQVFINNLKTHYHFRCQVKSTEKIPGNLTEPGTVSFYFHLDMHLRNSKPAALEVHKTGNIFQYPGNTRCLSSYIPVLLCF